jgi:cytochrome c oxidase subunit 2
MPAILKLPTFVTVMTAFALICCLPIASAEPTDGKSVYQKCVNCHGIAGQGVKKFWAPGIAGLPSAYIALQLKNFKTGIRGDSYSDVAGLRMRPMARMLKKQVQIKAVSDYVAKLKPAKPKQTIFDGDQEAGQKIYTKVCQSCHGPDAGGMTGLGTDLRYTGDWYLLTQLKNFRLKRRGAKFADGQGASMIGKVWPKGVDGPSVLNVPGTKPGDPGWDQAMKNVIAYVNYLAQQSKK